MEERVSKQSIRSKYLGYRDNLSFSERKAKSREIWSRLKQLECYKKADVVLVYMDYRSGVMTTGLVEELLSEESGKKVYAPKVEGLDIFFYEIKELNDLKPGYQGIREPEINPLTMFSEKEYSEHNCLVLVPGAVFDRELFRMGYGKGFYDRFIHKYDNIIKAGLSFSCQIAKQIPIEAHDKKMDYIITENAVFKA